MFVFIAVFVLIVVVLPAIYAVMIHLRDQREKQEERIRKAEAEGGQKQ